MPITSITIENFKGIKGPVKIELKPITLLFGPNSAGKSTVIQALHYAREIFERENVNADRSAIGGGIVNLGGFRSLVHRHDLGLSIALRFDLDLQNEDLPRYFEVDEEHIESNWNEFVRILSKVESAWVEVSVKWSAMLNRPLLQKYTVGINNEILAVIETSDDGRQIFLSRLESHHDLFIEDSDFETESSHGHPASPIKGGDERESLRSYLFIFEYPLIYPQNAAEEGFPGYVALHGQTSALPIWGKLMPIDRSSFQEFIEGWEYEKEILHVLSSLIVGTGELVRDALRKLCYLGPLRALPPRYFQPALTPDESRWSNGLAAWDTLFAAQEPFIDQVNDWLDSEDHLNCGYRVQAKEYKELDMNHPMTLSLLQGNILDEETSFARYLMELPTHRRLVLWEKASGIEVQPYDIGVGISQVLPVIVASLHARRGFVIIEQPELHIHPGLQVTLGDLFIEQIGKRTDLTFLLETHSEHLMLRLLRRIRETNDGELPPGAPALSPESLSIYFSEQGENGITFLPIRVDREGDFIDRWPRGFFNNMRSKLPRLIPAGRKIHVFLWKQREHGEKLHNRYILSEIAGILFGTGLDKAKDPESLETDDLRVLSSSQLDVRWKQYKGSPGAFDPATDHPVEIIGSA